MGSSGTSSISTSIGLETKEPSRQMIDLLLADDSPMNCQLMRGVFSRSRSSLRVVSCAVSRDEVMRSLKSCSVDVALISECLQDGPLSGLRLVSELRRAFPKIRTIVLLKSNSEDLVVDAFRAGARGVFHRNQPLQTLCKCIQVVQQGQIWATSSQLRRVLDVFVTAAPPRLLNSRGRVLLTKREDDVVRLVSLGGTNRDVAEKLGLTEHTVSNYLFRIYEKLGVSSRVELVLYALSSLRGPAQETGLAS